VAMNGKHTNQTFKFKGGKTLIGTGTDCDIVIDDQFMSSHHCEVRTANGGYKLVDLGSTNGIVVNNKKVAEHELIDNDQFRLGRTEFKFKSIS
jgi:pSer/pThr/pTyr-binding forkhead associated (FHA) protein